MGYWIIIECGSSKADWVLMDGVKKVEVHTSNGFNPLVTDYIPDSFYPNTISPYFSQIDRLYYYGPGVSTMNAQMSIGYQLSIKISGNHYINTDMLAAARACCGNEEGLVAILGTGSNSCYYDGKEVNRLYPSLGYLLGDHGSGNYIGKKLLQAYYYHTMPERLRVLMEEFGDTTYEEVIHKLYQGGSPNQYLGTWVPFCVENENDEWINEFIDNIFLEFVTLHFKSHKDIARLHLHFVGSVAHSFSSNLRRVCNSQGIKVGNVIQVPLLKLLEYHIKYE